MNSIETIKETALMPTSCINPDGLQKTTKLHIQDQRELLSEILKHDYNEYRGV